MQMITVVIVTVCKIKGKKVRSITLSTPQEINNMPNMQKTSRALIKQFITLSPNLERMNWILRKITDSIMLDYHNLMEQAQTNIIVYLILFKIKDKEQLWLRVQKLNLRNIRLPNKCYLICISIDRHQIIIRTIIKSKTIKEINSSLTVLLICI